MIQLIASGKIHDQKYLTSHQSEFDDLEKHYAESDSKNGIGVVRIKKDNKEEQIFYDSNSGERLFSKPQTFGYFKSYQPDLKVLLFSSKEGEIVVNRKGEIIKKQKPNIYSVDYKLYDDTSKKVAILDKNYDAASDYYDEIKFLFSSKNTGYYWARNGDSIGLIDHKGNVKYRFENHQIFVLNPDSAEYFVIQKPDGITEIISIKNLKTFLKIKLKPNTSFSLNKEKIFNFYIPDDKSNFSLDQYGNSVKFSY